MRISIDTFGSKATTVIAHFDKNRIPFLMTQDYHGMRIGMFTNIAKRFLYNTNQLGLNIRRGLDGYIKSRHIHLYLGGLLEISGHPFYPIVRIVRWNAPQVVNGLPGIDISI